MSELPEASGNARWLSSQCLHCIVGVRSARIGAKSAPHLARKAGVLDFRKRMRERDGLSAGGSRIRTLGPRSLLEARATAGSYEGSVAAKELRLAVFKIAPHTTGRSPQLFADPLPAPTLPVISEARTRKQYQQHPFFVVIRRSSAEWFLRHPLQRYQNIPAGVAASSAAVVRTRKQYQQQLLFVVIHRP